MRAPLFLLRHILLGNRRGRFLPHPGPQSLYYCYYGKSVIVIVAAAGDNAGGVPEMIKANKNRVLQ
jgi:hypothetical protein